MLLNDGYSILYFLFFVCFTTHTLFTTHDSNLFLKQAYFPLGLFKGTYIIVCESELFSEWFSSVCDVRFEAINILGTEYTNTEVLRVKHLINTEYSISENHA